MFRSPAIVPLAVISCLLLATPVVAAERFVIDPEHSRIGFSVPYDFMILGELEGEFREFAGELAYERSDLTRSTVWLEIVTASVDTRFRARDLGLKSDEYLAVDTYPTAAFRSTSVERVGRGLRLLGELTMRGITHPVTIECELLDLGETLVVQGYSSLSREAFDVDGPELSGEVMIGDEVSLTLQVVLRRASAES